MAEPVEAPLKWARRNETLAFRFGRYYLARVDIRAQSLQNPCTELAPDLDSTLARLPDLPPECDAAFLPAHPVGDGVPRARGLFGPVLQYVCNSGPRHLIDLRGSFDEYIAKFSRKRRHELRRTVRRFEELSEGALELRRFGTPEEMERFRDIAVELSGKTYKAAFGAAFNDIGPSRDLAEAAARGDVRGYVLYSAGRPAAYGFFRAQGSNLAFVHTAYDPVYTKSSPGTVMLWLILQELIAEQRFAYLDFLWGQYSFKELFATTTIHVAAIYCFRNTLRNKLLVGSHWALILLSRLMVSMTRALGIDRLVKTIEEKRLPESRPDAPPVA
ncbi:MAG: GNAT family N-acetyltransferase [Acidobacteriia bacterium]|nr:GNAT family N-acetyltransferase [Terriglobia bacterium]